MHKITKCLLAGLIVVTASGCRLKSKEDNKIIANGTADEYSKPNFIDTNLIFSWYDVKDKFFEIDDKINDEYSEIQEYNEQELQQLAREIGQNLQDHFEEGRTIYDLEYALVVYDDAVRLTVACPDEENVYSQIGMLARDAMLAYYGGYNEEVKVQTLVEDCEYLIKDSGISY